MKSTSRFRRPASSKLLRCERLTVHFLNWDGTDPPIILLHPNRTNSRVWDFFVDSSELPNRFIAPDLRGHGLSEYPKTGYEFEDYILDLLNLIDHLALDEIILIGAAMGGNLALLIAATHPSLVRALVLADPGLSLDHGISQRVQAEIEELFRFPDLETAKRNMPMSGLWTPEMLNHFARFSFKELPTGEVEWRYFPRGAQISENMLERDIWDQINVTCPTLILRGEHSEVFSEDKMMRLHSLIPNSMAGRVPGSDHRICQDNPKGMAARVDAFITQILT
jgi:pimeloyl-ACP methyl ester carboxylesterase